MTQRFHHPLAQIGIDSFFRDYWQQRPLLLRQALPDLVAPLEADELAGLSCEEEISSRIITGTWERNDFTVEHGPFAEDRYQSLGDKDWTLLVQDVDKIIPAAADLLDRFDFLPAWRVDDLMISFAAAGGSVGPHTDEYDVFLVQLEGRRRWQIAEQFDPALRSGLELKVLDQFHSEQEWVCEPGDILYLPPNVAHYGLALDACMTASVGLRAPSLADLLDDLANHWSDVERPPRYRDPDITAPWDRWCVDDAAVARFRQLLRHLSDAPDTEFKTWLGAALSRFRLATHLLEEPIPQRSPTADHGPDMSSPGVNSPGMNSLPKNGYNGSGYTLEGADGSADLHLGEPLTEVLQRYPHVLRQAAARLHWLALEDGQRALLCANGETHTTSIEQAQRVCACAYLEEVDRKDLALVSFLLNSCAFCLADDSEDEDEPA